MWLLLTVPWAGLRCVIVVFPDHTYLLFILLRAHCFCWYRFRYGPRRDKTCRWWFANNKGADQPAHARSLISAFVIR